VQHGAHFIGRQIDVGLAVVAQDKAVAVAVAGNGSLEFSEEAGDSAGGGVNGFDGNSLSWDASADRASSEKL
jgi:hypothetical protein